MSVVTYMDHPVYAHGYGFNTHTSLPRVLLFRHSDENPFDVFFLFLGTIFFFRSSSIFRSAVIRRQRVGGAGPAKTARSDLVLSTRCYHIQ